MLFRSALNQQFASAHPRDIIRHALSLPGKAVVTTHYGPLEAVILHLSAQVKPDIQVVWVDHGYNTKATYRCAEQIIQKLKLNVDVFTPRISAARQEAALGGIPIYTEDAHKTFTENFKLEPFRRAMAQHKPDIWLTALRKEQTEFRQSLNIFTKDDKGVLKVAPLFLWTEAQMRAYLAEHGLPNEDSYYDPTKALERALKGDAAAGKFVEHITFKGLSFQHSQWLTPPGGFEPTQAAAPVEAAVMADGARWVVFENCEIAHTGVYGIWFRKGCKIGRAHV